VKGLHPGIAKQRTVALRQQGLLPSACLDVLKDVRKGRRRRMEEETVKYRKKKGMKK
jgi:hypothetical protein